jgi:transcriptional regulator with XRE-family HTH domain
LSGAQIIREARLKAGLTQSELGARLGRDRAQVARWEIGGQEPSFENVQAVVEACGFELKLEIAERVVDQALDLELEAGLLAAPQQRMQSLLDRLGTEPDAGSAGLDPHALFDALGQERIGYVVVGGLARVLHGSAETTRGIDIAPSLRDDDLRRLVHLLGQLGAKRPKGEPLHVDELAATERTVARTDAGEVAVVPAPWGTRGYDDLRLRANRENLGQGARPPIASLVDCVRMLEASSRLIDHERIERLRRMMELERQRTRSRRLRLER